MKIGSWYPEASNGYLVNSKNVVSLGSAISYFAEKNQLKGFKLDSSLLKEKVVPKSKYLFSEGGHEIMNLKAENATFTAEQFPCRIMTSPISSVNYLRKLTYSLGFNRSVMIQYFSKKYSQCTKVELNSYVDDEIARINMLAPFTISLSRNIHEDPERLQIEEIVGLGSNDHESLNVNFFNISCETLFEGEYWLDNGFKFN